MRFKERLQYLRLKKGISEKKLGEYLGITESSIRLYENGKLYVKLEHLNKFADYFKVSPKLLLGTLFPLLPPEDAVNSYRVLEELNDLRKKEKHTQSSSAFGNKMGQAEVEQQSNASFVSLEAGMVAVFNKITSDKSIVYDNSQNVEFYWPVSDSIISMYGNDLANYFYLRMQGNSMEPTISNQNLVLAKKQLPVNNNDLAIVQYGNKEATVRRITFSQNKIVLDCDNNSFSSKIYDAEDCQILAKVLWKGSI